MKVLYNRQYGGFSINLFATLKYIEAKGLSIYPYILSNDRQNYEKATLENCGTKSQYAVDLYLNYDHGDTFPAEEKIPTEHAVPWANNPVTQQSVLRFDPVMIELFEQYGSKAVSGDCATLELIEISKGRYFTIDEYDGLETVYDFSLGEGVYYADH